MNKSIFTVMIIAILFVFTTCTSGESYNTPIENHLPTERPESGQTEDLFHQEVISTVEFEFIKERAGDLTFMRPAHWAGSLSDLYPHEGAHLEFWDADLEEDQPLFRVRQRPLGEAMPTLSDLLAEMLAEERIEAIDAGIAPIIYPVETAVVFGINIDTDAWQYGM